MPYQISKDRKDRSNALHAIIILKNEPYNVVYNKEFADFVFEAAQKFCIEEMSIELITANEFDVLQKAGEYSNQAINYTTKSNSSYNQIWLECTRKITVGESVVLTYCMGDNEDNSCDLRSLLNVIRVEKQHVKVIIADERIIPVVPNWFINAYLEREGVKEVSSEYRKTGLIKTMCKRISTIKERMLCEWYDLRNKSFIFKMFLFDRDNAGTIIPQYEPVEISLGKVRNEIIKELEPCTLDMYHRVEDEKQDIISNMREAQRELDKLQRRIRGLPEQINIKADSKKVISQNDASLECNLSSSGWRGVFDITHESEKRTLYAVAVGMRMSYKDLKWLMWCKGYVMKPSHNITDAVVTIFVRGFRHKSSIDINEVNLILLALNQKTLGEDITKRTKK